MSEMQSTRMSLEQIISTKWTVPIMQILLDGPARFSDLKRRLPLVSANVLTKRLRDLEQEDLLDRVCLPPPADRQAYILTPRGGDMRNVLEAIRALSQRWGEAP